MIYPSPDKLDGLGSKYSLVIVAAKRARQIKDGARKLAESRSSNPLTIALAEIAEDQITSILVGVPEPLPTSIAPEPSITGLAGLIIDEDPLLMNSKTGIGALLSSSEDEDDDDMDLVDEGVDHSLLGDEPAADVAPAEAGFETVISLEEAEAEEELQGDDEDDEESPVFLDDDAGAEDN